MRCPLKESGLDYWGPSEIDDQLLSRLPSVCFHEDGECRPLQGQEDRCGGGKHDPRPTRISAWPGGKAQRLWGMLHS